MKHGEANRVCFLATMIVCTMQFSHSMLSAAAASPKPKPTARELIDTPLDGYQFARAKHFPEAHAWAVKQLKSKPNDTDAMHLKAYAELVLGQFRQCMASASQLLSAKALVGKAHRLRADALHRLGDPESALSEINESIKINPYEEGLYATRRKIYASLKNSREFDRNEGIRHILSALRNAWDKVIEQDNLEEAKPSPTRKTPYHQEYSAGQKAFKRLAFENAVDYFTRVIQLKPDWLDAYLFRAQSLETLDRWAEAIPDLSHIIAAGENKMIPIRVAPNDSRIPVDKWDVVYVPMAEAYKRRARCYAALRKYSLAVADMDKAVKQEPEDRWTREIRGNINSAYKKYQDAIDDYLLAEKLDIGYLNCGPKIIECCTAKGDYEFAVRRISWLLKSLPTDDVLLIQRADCLSHLGYHKDAIKDLTFILSMDSEYIEAYLRRGREYESSGDLRNALDDYTKAMNLDKGSTEKSRRAFAGRDRVLRRQKQSP